VLSAGIAAGQRHQQQSYRKPYFKFFSTIPQWLGVLNSFVGVFAIAQNPAHNTQQRPLNGWQDQ
jgi:hypothetical protein